ncbi:hypothetical protein LOZ58_000699 [Ophidiomyces ophidiicola]|nr:hypothetical protein LOZ66_000391 [Ophidiomyces ophidiicola]KAI1965799.1 hypothetical protein LOZ58_000699 [Ophidiomyces ophidiicola]
MASSQPFPPFIPDVENFPEVNPYPGKPPANNAIDEEEDHDGSGDDIASGEDADFQSHYSCPPIAERDYSISTSGDNEREEEEEDHDDEDEDEDDNDDDEEDANAGDGGIALHKRLLQSTGSLPNTFAPPFYNRPPTPLPPSPSLTSLLRPSFSAHTSRPTTPDSSDVETPNDTEAAVAKSARIATTVPRASPKVPTYEYYGFVLYLASSLAFLIYLLWSFLPSPFLHQLGIYYYPNRWWSLAIPSFLVMTLVYIYVALAAYNTGYLTLPMNSIENLVDDAANIAVIDSKGRRRLGGSEKMNPDVTTALTMNAQKKRLEWKAIWNEGTDAVMDIPIGGVCEVLYGGEGLNEDGSLEF